MKWLTCLTTATKSRIVSQGVWRPSSGAHAKADALELSPPPLVSSPNYSHMMPLMRPFIVTKAFPRSHMHRCMFWGCCSKLCSVSPMWFVALRDVTAKHDRHRSRPLHRLTRRLIHKGHVFWDCHVFFCFTSQILWNDVAELIWWRDN